MPSRFFSDQENNADLLQYMPEEERERYLRFGHNRIEAAFQDRKFIVYQPTGLMSNGQHREPNILATLTVSDFEVGHQNGASATLSDLEAGGSPSLKITHVPRRVFNYPVYIAIPTNLTLRWDAREVNDRVWRSLSFAVLIKTKNRADFYSKGNTYMETPNKFRKLYPAVTGEFKF
jgi:hypothetical protein